MTKSDMETVMTESSDAKQRMEKNEDARTDRLIVSHAIAVEGRDDVAAVSLAADALIIPTHGFGITKETWAVLEKAYAEKGLIILTDPDHAGEQIRRMLTEKFPGAIQAYVARIDACKADDIGVENARPAIIRAALGAALKRAARMSAAEKLSAADGSHIRSDQSIRSAEPDQSDDSVYKSDTRSSADPGQCSGFGYRGDSDGIDSVGLSDSDRGTEFADMADLRMLGLAGTDGASERRAAVCRKLGIGYGNAGAMFRKLKGFGISRAELIQAVSDLS